MIERRAQVLVSSVRKLARRGAWKNIERILKKAHTADIGSLIQAMESDERLQIFRMVSPLDKRAGVLSHLELESQCELILALERKDANRLVEQMDSDDAADLLGHLPEEVAKEILESMVEESSEDVADLLRYPDDSAGGLMSSDFLPLKEEMTVSEAIKSIQEQEEDTFVAFYVYVVNESGRLVGVVSLKKLILTKPAVLLKDIMSTDIIAATTEMTQQEVAALVEKYDFLSIPVVDGSGNLVGVITVDDVIDVIREEEKEDFLAMGRAGGGGEDTALAHLRARLPWLGLAFLGGLLCFLLMDWMVDARSKGGWWVLVSFVPLLLSMGSTASQQAGTVMVGFARDPAFGWKEVRAHLLNEGRIAISASLIFGLLVLMISIFVFRLSDASYVVGGALGVQLLFSMMAGAFIPLGIRRSGTDPTAFSIPVISILSDVASVVILFRIASRMLHL